MTCVVGSGVVRAQESVGVTCAIPQPVEAKPARILAVGIMVTNPTGFPVSLQSRITLPRGWRIVARDFPFELPPRGSDVRLVSFSIPADAPAKNYDIRYEVRDSSGREEGVTIVVAVGAVIQLELQVLDAPRFAVAGVPFTTSFLLSNKGNALTSVRLNERSSHGFPILVDSSVTQLGPREMREIRLTVTPDVTSGKASHTLELEAVALPDSSVRVRASSVVDVVSGATKAEEEYFEFPVTVRLRGVGQDGSLAAQGEISGSGSLSEQKTDNLEFLFRGPQTQTRSFLGLRDEYRIAYRSRNLELYGGDLNYSLSTLTEYGRYATGAGGRATVGGFSAGGFYNETRWFTPAQKEAAGFLQYDVTNGASVAFNYLNKKESFNSDLATVRGLFTPLSGSNLDLEYGAGTKDGKRDDAYAVRFDGNHRWLAYDLRYVNAGSNFGGYYRDVNFISANVNIQVLSQLRIESYARQEDRNLARDTNQVYAPRDDFYQVGASYSDNIALFYRRTLQRDQLRNPKYRRHEDALQGRLGYSFRDVSLALNADYGLTQDELLNVSSPYRRLALYTSFRPIGGQNYSTSLEYSREKNLYTTEDQERLSASLNAWILLARTTQLQLSVYTSRVNATQPPQTYTLIDGSLGHTFPFKHTITFRARQNIITSTSVNKEIAYLLEYAIPIGVPIRRISAVGQLRGTVRDEQGRGLANVLINAGEQAALTDGKGEYLFPSLKPGTAIVTVDKASIGLDRITVQPTPIEVPVTGGEESRLDIGVTRSVTVSGAVRVFDLKETSPGDTTTTFVEIGGRPGVFLELSRGTEINRRVTDSRGNFSFTDLRPGPWTLNVIGGDIPEYHIVVPESSDLVTKAGERRVVSIEIRQRKRAIKILQEGTITQQSEVRTEVKPAQQAVQKTAPAKAQLPCLVYFDARKKSYFLQISSWLTVKKAVRVAREAQRVTGKKAFTVTARIPSLGKRVRVYLGYFASVKEAEQMCLKVNADG